MNLKIMLTVKFRFLRMTIGTLGPIAFRFPVPTTSVIFAQAIRDGLKFDDRGVKLEAVLEPG